MFLHGDFGLSSEIDVFLYQFLYEVDQLNIIMVLNCVFIMCLSAFFKSYFQAKFHRICCFFIKIPKLLTLPETSIALKNGWLEDEIPFGMAYLQVVC